MRFLRLPGVFAPISDSWMLAGLLARESLGPDTRVLDLCTGSGVLAITAALGGAGRVEAVDISRRSVLAVRLNAALNGVNVHTRRGDLFGAVAGRFDVIVSNPPYVPGPRLPDRGLARAWEAGPEGRVFLDRICAQAPRHLKPGGVLLMCQSTICGEQETLEALRAGGLDAEIAFRHTGKLGRLMRSRESWLRHMGLLDGDRDEVIVVRARAKPEREAGPPEALPAAAPVDAGGAAPGGIQPGVLALVQPPLK